MDCWKKRESTPAGVCKSANATRGHPCKSASHKSRFFSLKLQNDKIMQSQAQSRASFVIASERSERGNRTSLNALGFFAC